MGKKAIDRYTPLHFAAGLALGYAGLKVKPALAIAVGWEIAEIGLKKWVPQMFPQAVQDSIGNATVDVLATMIGWTITGAKKNPHLPRLPRYEPLTRKQQERGSRFIGQEIRTGKYPRKQAIAIGLARATRG